jgi:hypothetical protein
MTGLIELNSAILKRIEEERLNIEQLWILDAICREKWELLDMYDSAFTKERVLMNYQNLQRKLLIIPDPTGETYYIASLQGKELYNELLSINKGLPPVFTVKSNNKARNSDFDEWWSMYPATAGWTTDDGRKFLSGRSLRSGSKEDNRKAYLAILNEGRYTPKDLVDCLKYEIAAKKSQSLLTGNNHLQFMKGSLAYLNQRTFENFIDLVRSGDSIDEKTSNWEIG